VQVFRILTQMNADDFFMVDNTDDVLLSKCHAERIEASRLALEIGRLSKAATWVKKK
jgi:hypothetical protein